MGAVGMDILLGKLNKWHDNLGLESNEGLFIDKSVS
jgi:hypothetical protein